MQRKTIDVMVGLFVLLGAAALVFLALQAGNLASFGAGATYRVSAMFDNIGSLKPRAPVRSAGVTVGRVHDIGFDTKTFQAVVTMEIDQRYPFPKDTSASILTAGLLGEQYIGLSPGGDPDNLKVNDRIETTQSAVVLENLISQFLFKSAAEGDKSKGAGASGTATPSGASGGAPATPAPAGAGAKK